MSRTKIVTASVVMAIATFGIFYSVDAASSEVEAIPARTTSSTHTDICFRGSVALDMPGNC